MSKARPCCFQATRRATRRFAGRLLAICTGCAAWMSLRTPSFWDRERRCWFPRSFHSSGANAFLPWKTPAIPACGAYWSPAVRGLCRRRFAMEQSTSGRCMRAARARRMSPRPISFRPARRCRPVSAKRCFAGRGKPVAIFWRTTTTASSASAAPTRRLSVRWRAAVRSSI